MQYFRVEVVVFKKIILLYILYFLRHPNFVFAENLQIALASVTSADFTNLYQI